MNDEQFQAAAMSGIATNKSFPIADRLQAALQALDYYGPKDEPQKIYIAVIADRHADPEPYPFSTPEAAIAFATAKAHEYARTTEDVEESAIDGWLYHASYSPESDSVWVIEKSLDEDEL